MKYGLSFLKSKIARKFCTLFILCAFTPTLILAIISYYRVVSQIEEQSFVRLKRETKSYGLGLFDRLNRVENELVHLSRNLLVGYGEFVFSDERQKETVFSMLLNVSQYLPRGATTTIYGELEPELFSGLVVGEYLDSPKSYILTLREEGQLTRVFMGVNYSFADGSPASLIGEIKPHYLWGLGPSPLLPPMTDLLIFNATGENIVGTSEQSVGNYRDLEKKYVSEDLRIFRFELLGKEFFGSFSNLFIESRYQRTGWVIIIAQARSDIMSVLDDFSNTFPFVMLLFLLLTLYLSVKFIRNGLVPLEELKAATGRVGGHDFSEQVKIQGDDEFAELGIAFNTMSKKIEKQFHTMGAIGEIDRAILSSTDKATILSTTLHGLKTFYKCDIALFTRSTENSDNFLKVSILKGRRSSDPAVEYFNINEGDKECLFGFRDYLILDRETGMPSFLKDAVEASIVRYFCFPIFVDDDISRIILLGWKTPYNLSADDKEHARQIADQLAVALTNSKLLENLEHLASGTVEALARTVDAKSRWTSGHSERVAELSSRIAKNMGFSDNDVAVIKRGGLMHDIGKIGVSLAILDKPGKLTDEEYREVKNHPSIGAKILEPIEAFSDILTIVEQHHEKYDGTGYPAGLKGKEISLNARILAVVDVWDALVSNRPYRDGWVHDRAKLLITEGSGTHFDPQVVKTFLAVMES